jgi:hypothetical protein
MEQTSSYAIKQISMTAEEDGFMVHASESGKIYLVSRSGKSYQLAEEEIKYQAIEYLKNQISNIEHNF